MLVVIVVICGGSRFVDFVGVAVLVDVWGAGGSVDSTCSVPLPVGGVLDPCPDPAFPAVVDSVDVIGGVVCPVSVFWDSVAFDWPVSQRVTS